MHWEANALLMGLFARTIVMGCLLFCARFALTEGRSNALQSANHTSAKTSPKDTWTLSDSHCFATIQYRSDIGRLAEVCIEPGESAAWSRCRRTQDIIWWD